MNLTTKVSSVKVIVVVVVVASSTLLFAPCCSSSSPDSFDGRAVDDDLEWEWDRRRHAAAAPADDGIDDDEDIDDVIDYDIVDVESLEDLSDNELVDVCTSRGFEMLLPSSSSSSSSSSNSSYSSSTSTTSIDYDDDWLATTSMTRRDIDREDYVRAARECLTIEYEMEEALRPNRVLSHAVRMESERMMTRSTSAAASSSTMIENPDHSTNFTSVDPTHDGAGGRMTVKGKEEEMEEKDFVALDLVELTREVIARVRSDVAFVVGVVSPSPKLRAFIMRASRGLWSIVRPTSSAVVSIFIDAWDTTRDMARRYAPSFSLLGKTFEHRQGKVRSTTTTTTPADDDIAPLKTKTMDDDAGRDSDDDHEDAK
ncbi:hypothetical protein ACHAXA_005236 [Cyclostephanos tholiformis]|uniref:Uncharacterized protein n=1 Tax=Cyclostephanos tholiformis TaxID=382380 RepID=A0ABD3SFI6_9STRA